MGYNSAKEVQDHLARLMAIELGINKIRVNTVNPDAVITDSNIWVVGWAEGYGMRCTSYNYAKRTLLNEIILLVNIANA